MIVATAYNTCVAVMAQVGVALVGFGMLAFAPPPHGAMLLYPIVDGTPIVRLARDRDALLVAVGPGGSVIVQGDRQSLFWPLLRAGVVTIAAPASYCGGRV